MAEIRFFFNKEWDTERRLHAIQQRIDDLKDCQLIRLQLEEQYGREGSVVKVKSVDWNGVAEQELLLKTATSFLITYGH